MDSEECVERIRLTDVYGELLADFHSRLEALKRSPDDDIQYREHLSEAELALQASQQAWAALARHIAEHQCVELWSKSDSDSREILAEAADAALDIILVADDNRRFVDVNEAATRLLGLSREQIVGRRIDEFFSLDPGVASAWSSFVAEGIQSGICKLRTTGPERIFEYRAKANFAPGFHVSVLRECT